MHWVKESEWPISSTLLRSHQGDEWSAQAVILQVAKVTNDPWILHKWSTQVAMANMVWGATNEEYFVQCIDFRLVVQLNPSDLMIGTLVIKQPN